MARNGLLSLTAVLLMVFGAWAQDGGAEREATIKLVDADRGLAVVAFPSAFGQRIFEVPIPADTKFVSKDGKKMKEGLKDPTFQSGNNRLQVPVKIQYGTGGSAGTIKKITLQ